VLNPDGAPLSAAEEARLATLLQGYARKQGFDVAVAAPSPPPGAPPSAAASAAPPPVPRALLHAYPTLFFLREAAAELRALRARARAHAAAAAAAAAASATVDAGGAAAWSPPVL